MDIELRHLRALIAVAEDLNFTRAAQRLHLTQQALSGQIRQLEVRVGASLLERDTRSVSLTPAGAALYAEAGPLLDAAQRALAGVRVAAGDGERLVIGVIAPMTLRLLTPVLEAFAADRPDVELELHFASFLDPTAGLRQREADVAFVYGRFEAGGLDLRTLFEMPRGVAVSTSGPLAGQSTITAAEFVAQPIVDVPLTDRVWRDFWIAAEHRGGRPPRVSAVVRTLDGLIEAVGAGLGVAVTVGPAVEAFGPATGVSFLPCPDLEPLEFSLANRSGDPSPAVASFAESVMATYAAPPR